MKDRPLPLVAPADMPATLAADGDLPAKAREPGVFGVRIADGRAAAGMTETPDLVYPSRRVREAVGVTATDHDALLGLGDDMAAAGAAQPAPRAALRLAVTGFFPEPELERADLQAMPDRGNAARPNHRKLPLHARIITPMVGMATRYPISIRMPMIATTPAKIRFNATIEMACATRAPAGAKTTVATPVMTTAGQ